MDINKPMSDREFAWVSPSICDTFWGEQPIAWWTANVGVEEEALEVEEPKGSEVSPER